jgi:hypothetical protein
MPFSPNLIRIREHPLRHLSAGSLGISIVANNSKINARECSDLE